MTSQTKKFIEPSDILSLRIQCTNAKCGATLMLPISGDIDVKRLYVCPNCERPWVRLPSGTTAELAIAECVGHIKTLSGLLSGGQFNGFALSLEIQEETKPTDSERR
jgi:hypothetical protein